eukprot:10522259-Alexandrium_andersonii.AAC.1
MAGRASCLPGGLCPPGPPRKAPPVRPPTCLAVTIGFARNMMPDPLPQMRLCSVVIVMLFPGSRNSSSELR